MEFVEFFRRLENLGMTDALLPFLLIFTVIFAVLQKSNILGEGKRNFNVIVSTVISLMVVIPHVTGSYPANRDVIDIMNGALPQISIVVVAILMALLLIGILGGEAKWMGGSLSGVIALIAFAVVVYVFGAEAGWWANYPRDWRWWGSDTSSVVLIILVFAIVIWYITREPSDADKAGAFSNAFSKLGDMFKK
jgi:hypothetical protein